MMMREFIFQFFYSFAGLAKRHKQRARTTVFLFYVMHFLTNLSDRILAWPIDNIVQRTLSAHIIDADELEQRRIDEAHADAVPNIHGRQVGHDRQCAAEAVRCCEEIQHCRYACQNEIYRGILLILRTFFSAFI